ncbi:MAG: hypothetical protein NT167_01000 [Verrucomicrobia bacterium]|nr:hypothetical protein [Verrucomicrobiota bacterium]
MKNTIHPRSAEYRQARKTQILITARERVYGEPEATAWLQTKFGQQ